MILIQSEEYISLELQGELGLLPKAFLPIANKRLFELQVEMLSSSFPGETIYLTVPNQYKIPLKDIRWLDKNNVSIICSSEALTSEDKISSAVKWMDLEIPHLRILNGATLFDVLPNILDICILPNSMSGRKLQFNRSDSNRQIIETGYYAFSKKEVLYEYLIGSPINFISAVNRCKKNLPLHISYADDVMDLDEIHGYFECSQKKTTERKFNKLKIIDGVVYKTGSSPSKIIAEAHWFENIPLEIKKFTPALLEVGVGLDTHPYYALEYLRNLSLNQIYVHGNKPIFFWNSIFSYCTNFLEICISQHLNPDQRVRVTESFSLLVNENVYDRLANFLSKSKDITWESSFDFNGIKLPCLKYIFEDCLDLTQKIKVIPGVSHGDFCFSNILFNSQTNTIKVVDPRGLDGFGNQEIFGNISYDIAKLTQSVIGLYDYIISGAYSMSWSVDQGVNQVSFIVFASDETIQIQDKFFRNFSVGGLRPLDVMPLVVLLFLSMLPLHDDDSERQLALLANALRLYSAYFIKKNMEN